MHAYHGLCGSNKQLYKRCAKSMGRPKFRPPQLPHFSTDLNETWNQERYPGYDPTCKIWLMWDDGKGVCVGNEIWDKIGYNSLCVRDICKIFASIGVFSVMGHWMQCCQLHFLLADPRCHGNEIWSKMGYNSVPVRNICEIFASVGGFWDIG